MKSSIALLLLACCIVLSSCGDGEEVAETVRAGYQPDTVVVEVADTVGVMMGDSAFVFGNITDATLTPDGRLLVLDGLKSRIGVFSNRCEHIGFAGRAGSGPGEYQYPKSFALLDDGGLAVCDWGGIAVTHLTEELDFDTVLTGYRSIAPDRIVPGLGGAYVGMSLSHELVDGEPQGENFIARFDRSTEPDLIYCSYPMRFTVDDDGDLNVHTTSMSWDTGPDGSVWVAVCSDSTWGFTGYDSGGDTLLSMEKPWERKEKSAEELEEGYLHESLSTSRTEGSSVNRDRLHDNIPMYYNAIDEIDVDDAGRIWVAQGWTEVPTFDVYDSSGELLFVATIPALENDGGMAYCFENGMIAFDTQPEDYPKVYLLSTGESL